MATYCVHFLWLLGFVVVQSLCPISRSECGDILFDRFEMKVDDFHELPNLKQFIVQDRLNCIDADSCPLELEAITGGEVECEDGCATELGYPCNGISLQSFVPIQMMGGNVNASGNDIWGWTVYDADGAATAHYAIAGLSDGTSIVDVTDPINPNVLAFVEQNVYPKSYSFCLSKKIQIK